MIVLSLSYIVYRKEQSKTRRKSRERIGREYDQISQISQSHWLTSFIKFNIDRVIPKPHGINLASIFKLSTFIR